MPSHAAFLRGVNLGGRRRVTNAELAAALEAAGFEQVGTFRASGNVVFTTPRRASDETLQRRVEEGLERALGYAVRTFVRSAQEVSAIATRRPFPAGAVRASTGKLQVALLARPAPARARKQALALAGAHDLLAFGERELYWLPRARMTDSELDLARLEGLVGPWTMRTKATIEQLAERHLSA